VFFSYNLWGCFQSLSNFIFLPSGRFCLLPGIAPVFMVCTLLKFHMQEWRVLKPQIFLLLMWTFWNCHQFSFSAFSSKIFSVSFWVFSALRCLIKNKDFPLSYYPMLSCWVSLCHFWLVTTAEYRFESCSDNEANYGYG